VALAGLRADLLAELGQPVLAATVGDDGVDRRQRRPNRRDLAARLPAAADHAQRAGAIAREVLRRNTAGRAGPQLAELVGFDHRDGLGRLGLEEEHHEVHALPPGRVRLQPGQADPAVDGPHHREETVLEPSPLPRHVFDLALRQPLEGTLHRAQRVLDREQLGDLRLR
jgi:hypothetical protein